MINLLPPKAKTFIRREYSARQWTMIFLLTLLSFTILTLFLSPSLFLSSTKENALSSELEAIRSEESHQEIVAIEEQIKELNERVGVLTADNKVIYSEALNLLLSIKPDQVFLQQIDFQKRPDQEAVGTLTLTGTAINRTTLSGFADSLQAEDIFENVQLPISSFVAEQDLEFNITLEIVEN